MGNWKVKIGLLGIFSLAKTSGYKCTKCGRSYVTYAFAAYVSILGSEFDEFTCCPCG